MNTTENTTTTDTDTTAGAFEPRATYSPEDNKLRLYVGRVPREEYLALRAAGWTCLHKQRESGGGDFAATWTPARRDTALKYAGMIEDEDKGPAERAAERAERFGGYRDKRLAEATGHADRFDAGPAAHGFQSQARAERAAARHDRIGDRATDAWGKADYWKQRTAGVIAHALYKSTPAVRMGRIKEIMLEKRQLEKSREEYLATWRTWEKIAAMPDAAKQAKAAEQFAGVGYSGTTYKHPHNGRDGSLWDLLREDKPDRITGAEAAALYFAKHVSPDSPEWQETRTAQWIRHCELRLAYEQQMVDAAGGCAADVEMIPGGFIGERQILKVNKSNATGRVVSVVVMGTRSGFTRESGFKEHKTWAAPVQVNIERAGADCYRPPTEEEHAAFLAARKAEKAARPKAIKPPLVNPNEVDAERLQALWNAAALADHCERHLRSYGKDYASEFKPSTVCRITQAVYSAASKGSYSRAETRNICGQGIIEPRQRFYDYDKQAREAKERGPVVCQVRTTGGDGSDYGAKRVIVLTDKPQKALPAAVWEKHVPAPEPAAGPSENIECSACGRTRPRSQWEVTSNALFPAAIICPACNMHHAATNQNKTAPTLAAA